MGLSVPIPSPLPWPGEEPALSVTLCSPAVWVWSPAEISARPLTRTNTHKHTPVTTLAREPGCTRIPVHTRSLPCTAARAHPFPEPSLRCAQALPRPRWCTCACAARVGDGCGEAAPPAHHHVPGVLLVPEACGPYQFIPSGEATALPVRSYLQRFMNGSQAAAVLASS